MIDSNIKEVFHLELQIKMAHGREVGGGGSSEVIPRESEILHTLRS